MKANISLNVCLRVTDRMQSHELIGTNAAADISPSMPGGAYCHDGQRVMGFRCSAVRHVETLVDAIDTAARFHGCTLQQPLFSAPLAEHVTMRDLRMLGDEPWHGIPFALADNGAVVVAHLPGHRSRQYRHHRRLWPRQDESSAALRIAVVSERHAHGAIHLQDTERLPYRQGKP